MHAYMCSDSKVKSSMTNAEMFGRDIGAIFYQIFVQVESGI